MAASTPSQYARQPSGRGFGRFPTRKQSSRAPVKGGGAAGVADGGVASFAADEIGPEIKLMYMAHDNDLDGIRGLLESGLNPDYRDADGRTALHVAACEGFCQVVDLLLRKGARVDPEDRWGSTPLADAIHYKKHEVIELLEKHGAKVKVAPMHVNSPREVPEYEIMPSELDFTNSKDIDKGTFQIATWRGTQVAVKKLDDDFIDDEVKVEAFRDELALLQLVRHPNVVQFLGAVTQSSPMMIVTEYLPKGNFRDYLTHKGGLKPLSAVKYALEIARGMNYLHEHKPPIIHRDLEPSNILRDDSGHLKVADFGVSKLLRLRRKVKEDKPVISGRYVAPEVLRNEEYDMKVDVFSFALILQEMIEGNPPFKGKRDSEIANGAYSSIQRPPFRASMRHYSHGLKKLIEECWSQNPVDRPSFQEIIERLSFIQKEFLNPGFMGSFLRCIPGIDAFFNWKNDSSADSSRTSQSSHSRG